MINRLSAPVHTAPTAIVGAVLLLLNLSLPNTVLAQQASYTVPRTADGKPDLQGLWTNNTITPLERPARFEGKPTLTAEEQRAWEQQIADRTAEADLPSDPNRPAPTKDQIDLEDSYNNFWFDDGTTVAVYNGEPRTSLVVDPADGRVPAPTAAARARMDMAAEERRLRPSDGPESRSLAERCLLSFGSSSGPPMLPILYNNYYQIVQSPGYVMILVEMVHDARIIRIDDEPLPAALQPWLGDSIGRWEGETLVVETHNFHPLQTYRGSADQFRTTERFTRVGPDTINYSFTVNDPDTFTSAWTAEIPMIRTDNKMYEYACHEGNYALPGILAGTRVEEREAGANQ
ncbi:MAG: hypothetical protein Q7V56_16955 [Gammaproteobacteria bacterium]|nr:hypothetical protein [Gammaproteobacteria bacterium]